MRKTRSILAASGQSFLGGGQTSAPLRIGDERFEVQLPGRGGLKSGRSATARRWRSPALQGEEAGALLAADEQRRPASPAVPPSAGAPC
jgi:hypothetical protein